MTLEARRVAAVSLMAGFYLLALAIVGALLAVPYLLYRNDFAPLELAGVVIGDWRLGFWCGLGALVIAWGVLPRPDRFSPPGPRLEPGENARLFSLLASVARRTGGDPPGEVYVVPDMNAWVASRGAFMGFGARSAMGIGLPLLQVMNVREIEAVLAHEFGHLHAGGSRLDIWIYKTRAAMERTLKPLGIGVFLHLPFCLYARAFLRVTQAISRAQELAADRLAATHVGARALIEGLKKLHAHAPVFASYWEQHALPVLEAGYAVPLRQGYERFLSAPRVQETLTQPTETAPVDPYDSHPPCTSGSRR